MVVAVDVYVQTILFNPSNEHILVDVTIFTPLIANVNVITIFIDPKYEPPIFIYELNLKGNYSLCYPKELAKI